MIPVRKMSLCTYSIPVLTALLLARLQPRIDIYKISNR